MRAFIAATLSAARLRDHVNGLGSSTRSSLVAMLRFVSCEVHNHYRFWIVM